MKPICYGKDPYFVSTLHLHTGQNLANVALQNQAPLGLVNDLLEFYSNLFFRDCQKTLCSLIPQPLDLSL